MKIEQIIETSILRQSKDIRSPYYQLTKEAASDLARKIRKDIIKEAEKDDSLYLELYL